MLSYLRSPCWLWRKVEKSAARQRFASHRRRPPRDVFPRSVQEGHCVEGSSLGWLPRCCCWCCGLSCGRLPLCRERSGVQWHRSGRIRRQRRRSRPASSAICCLQARSQWNGSTVSGTVRAGGQTTQQHTRRTEHSHAGRGGEGGSSETNEKTPCLFSREMVACLALSLFPLCRLVIAVRRTC